MIAFYGETASSALSSFTITASTSYFSNTRVFRSHTNVASTGEKFCNNCAVLPFARPSCLTLFIHKNTFNFCLPSGELIQRHAESQSIIAI